MRTARFILVLIGLMLATLTPLAQESRPRPLRIGDAVTGEITNERYEVVYEFESEATEIILFELKALDRSGDLRWPEIQLLGDNERVLLDSNNWVSIYESVGVLVMPYSGSYMLIVGRDDGRTGDSVGEYELRILRPQRLVMGETLSASALNDGNLNYYSVQPNGASFSIYYELQDGALRPYIQAYRIDEDAQMISIATLSGEELVSGNIGIDGASGELFIFTVGDSPYAYYYDNRTEQADYRLRLILEP